MLEMSKSSWDRSDAVPSSKSAVMSVNKSHPVAFCVPWPTVCVDYRTLRDQDTSELLPKFGGNYCRLGRTVWPGVRTYIAVAEFSGTELAVCSLQRVHNWLFFQTLLLLLNVYRQSRAGYTKISQVHNNSTVCWGKSMVGWSVELNTGHHGLYWMCEK